MENIQKEFIIKGWTPFDLICISKEEFYEAAEREYQKQFNKYIKIDDMKLCFITKWKIKVTLIKYK